MGLLSEDLKKFIQNPDTELDKLPDLLSRLETFENEHTARIQEHQQMEEEYQNRFTALQKTNRELIRQIPVTQDNPNEPKKPETPSTADIVRALRTDAFGEGKE